MKHHMLLSVTLLLCLQFSTALGDSVALIKIDGAIGPATAEYIGRGIREANVRRAQCLLIQLDTPGGLLDSTKVIVQELFASPVPTVVYIAPSGATAASAGCFITLAADVAAMAPATTIGAAHPVQMAGGVSAENPDQTMSQKLESYAASYIEMIAIKRQRNVEWAKSAVKESASISAEKALELKVVDITAGDLTDLLVKLDGRVANGRTLKTAGLSVVEIEMSWREMVFQRIWRPEVMFFLMLVAIYGIIGELSHPGVILPGVVGSVALVLALYMAAILPVNTAGVLLIFLALLLFGIDIFAPTHGVLTAGGIGAFFIGSLMLFEPGEPGFRLSLNYIVSATVVTAAFFVLVVRQGLRAQRLPVKVGVETMLGKTVEAITPINSVSGKVFVEGECWNAVSTSPVAKGQMVEIAGVRGLMVEVKPLQT